MEKRKINLLNERFFEQTILLSKLFYWTNYFSDRTILLNKQFYWTNNFTERTFLLTDLFTERTILLNERDGKWTLFLEWTKSSFWTIEKSTITKWVVHKRWTNEKSQTFPSQAVAYKLVSLGSLSLLDRTQTGRSLEIWNQSL